MQDEYALKSKEVVNIIAIGDDKEHSLESNLQHSLKTNSTGYFRVNMDKTRQGKPQYVYRYYENKKPKKLKSISLVELERKVREKGLEWIKLSDV